MKAIKFATAALVASLVLATAADAGSIGRSGGSSSSHSSSSASRSSSSFSAPSRPSPAPSVAPAPSKPGGIGGNTQGSAVGVRKSEVTAPVAQQVRPATPSANPDPGKPGSFSAPAPSYGTAAPAYSAPAPVVVQGGGGFGSSFMGSLGGTLVGNALFGNHGHSGGGTTVINNGTPSGGSANPGVVSQGPSSSFDQSGGMSPNGIPTQPKKEYTVWSFIADLFGFVIVVALLLGVAWLFYKGFQLVRNYVNKERGVSNIPFNPTQQFWTIQKAFAAADVTALQGLLGPDIVDELTNGLTASSVTLHNVSHEVRLANNTEFSIWYKFEDDGAEVNQVWHYEKFGKDWKLNGIETV